MNKKISWGQFPYFNPKIKIFDEINLSSNFDENIIPHGNGRSYGDSCINENVVDTKILKYFLSFDKEKGLLHLQSGILLSEIIQIILPYGWFLKIVPGTKFITLGGAIASDIHGKNHHIEGCFSECVNWFKLLMPDGKIVRCDRELNQDLFKATCGGMGLTGIITEAQISLKKVSSSYINQTTIKTKNLKETFNYFENLKDVPYSVAWIDCLSKDDSIGKSLIMHGDFMQDGKIKYKRQKTISVPFNMPNILLNRFTVKLFNYIYYNRILSEKSNKIVSYESFFFPLDFVLNWNRIYGRKGFVQYQFILPKENSYDGLKSILGKISDSGEGSFLSVLKLYGKENENFLIIPFRRL